jgi:hypothetical protein
LFFVAEREFHREARYSGGPVERLVERLVERSRMRGRKIKIKKGD